MQLQKQIDKSKKRVITTFMALFVVGVFESIITTNEPGLTNLILGYLVVLIFLLSTMMSAYWILLTDEFWEIYNGSDTRLWTKITTGLKFIAWIPGMGLCFYLMIGGFVSIYNRATGGEMIIISGEIVDKDRHTSRRYGGNSRCYFEISDKGLGRNVQIEVQDGEFRKFRVGDSYEAKRKIGGLGLIYETR